MRFSDFVHVINPNSEKRSAVQKFFKKQPELQTIFVERTSHPKHLETVIEWAVNEGHLKIAVWGGDGTLNRVVQQLHDMKALDRVVIALIPVGTCNDFARALHTPAWKRYLEVCVLNDAVESLFDVGLLTYASVDGTKRRVFVNNAGFGREASALRQHRSSALSDIFSFSPKRVDLDWSLNGTHSFETRDALLGVICNGAYFSKGLRFNDQPTPSDGLLDIFLESPQSPFRLLLSFATAKLGSPLQSSKTAHIQANELSLQASSLLYLQADGEPVESRGSNKLTFKNLPSVLRMAQWS